MGKINIVLDIQDKITKVRESQNFKRDVIERKYKESKEKLEKENERLSNLIGREVELIEKILQIVVAYSDVTQLSDSVNEDGNFVDGIHKRHLLFMFIITEKAPFVNQK